ncbi:MAG TPA: ABC transporter substrate-binding protein [Dehalococcoidia bacterium]|nr:ABC transporter substrate-binding protein [Dehalococcoidia bacterium]
MKCSVIRDLALITLLLIVLLSLVLGGCKVATTTVVETAPPTTVVQTTTAPPTTVVQTITAPPTTVVQTVTATPTAPPRKILRFAVPAFDAEVFDPILHSSVAAYQYLVYPNLVGGDLHFATADQRTGLAYKWEASADNTTWTFYLRKDARWWDGTPITAHDVKFSIPRHWQPGSRVGRPAVLKKLLGGDNADEEVGWRIEIIDDYTIRFHLAAANFRFADLVSAADEFSRIVPKHWAEKHGEGALATGAMGAGPYKIAEHVAGSLIRFKAWPEHPFQQPVYDELYYMAVPEESTRLAMLKKGEIDIGEFSFERLPELEKAGFEIIRKPTGVLWTILFTEPYKDPILAKKEVRKAIMMAIDKEAFNNAFFFGAGEYINDGGNVAQVADPRGMVTRDPIPYNLDEAKRIIAAEVPEGYKLQFIGVVRGPVKTEHIEAIAGMLERAGFNVELQILDYKTFRPRWMDGKIGPGIYLKNGRKYLVYYPTIYACSPENKGRHHVIQSPPKVEVNPDIPQEDLESLRCMDDLILGRLVPAKNWDEYWQAYSDIMDRCIEQIAPGSGFLFTPRIFAVRPGVLPEWEVNLGYNVPINLSELVVYPPEYEASAYHPAEYEGAR